MTRFQEGGIKGEERSQITMLPRCRVPILEWEEMLAIGISQQGGKASFGGTKGSAPLKLPLCTSVSTSRDTTLQGCSERERMRERRMGREERKRGKEEGTGKGGRGREGFFFLSFFF